MSKMVVYFLAVAILLFSPASLLVLDATGKKLRKAMLIYGKNVRKVTPRLFDPFNVGTPRMHAATSSGIIWSLPTFVIFLLLALPDTKANFQLTVWSIAFILSVTSTIVIQWMKLKAEEGDESHRP